MLPRMRLRTAPTSAPISYDEQAATLMLQASRGLEPDLEANNAWNLDFYSVMHKLCRTMTSRYVHARFRHFFLGNLGFPDINLTEGHTSFEMRPIEQRHHLVQLSAWVLADLEPRLTAAWRVGAIRYNVLFKDFPDPPDWYFKIIEKFSRWRDRIEIQPPP
jgi:hypothetical protein